MADQARTSALDVRDANHRTHLEYGLIVPPKGVGARCAMCGAVNDQLRSRPCDPPSDWWAEFGSVRT